MKVGIIGGSGLDDPNLLDFYEETELETPYGKPSDKITEGKINNVQVAILSRHGKDHSIMPTKVPFRANVWALKEIGCTHLVATTACGSLRSDYQPGQLVVLDQFIDFTKHRVLTFFEDKVIHTAMADPFDEFLRQKIIVGLKDLNFAFHAQGTMITIEGPRFSCRAESLMFQSFGADVINMSTVPEVILAKELEIPYASIAMVTDYDSWKDDSEPVTWELIVKRMQENSQKVKDVLIALITDFGKSQKML